jgi:hypothetical protein
MVTVVLGVVIVAGVVVVAVNEIYEKFLLLAPENMFGVHMQILLLDHYVRVRSYV